MSQWHYRIYLSISICLPICLSLSLPLFLSIYLSAPASPKNVRCVWTPREASTRPKNSGASIALLRGRSPMRICSQPHRHHHRNSIQIHGLELMSFSVLYGFRMISRVTGCPGNSYPTRGGGLLCTWVPVSTRLLIVQVASKALH